MTLQHIVLFSFPSALSAEDEAQLRALGKLNKTMCWRVICRPQ